MNLITKMSNFFLPKNQENLKNDSTQNQDTKVNQKQAQQQPVRKIIIKKKNQKLFNQMTEDILQTESQHYHENQPPKNINNETVNTERDAKKKLKPFISFMASQHQSYQELQTPYLHGPTQNYDFGNIKKNEQTVPIEEVEDISQRMIGRTKTTPIEEIPIKIRNNQNSELLMRRNSSMRSDFQSFNKRPTPVAVQIFSQKNDYSSMYERSKHGSRPRLSRKSIKQKNISVLEDQFSQNMDSVEYQQPKSTQSTQYLLRQDNYEVQNNQGGHFNYDQKMERRNMNQNMYQFENKLSAAIQSSQSESQSQESNQLTSRMQIPVQNYVLSKPSAYVSYIEVQARQLQQQQKMMDYYAEETNKILCNVQNYDLPIKDPSLIEKHYHPLKYMMEELVELFCLGQVIKYQLRYRSYQILNKIYAEASKYYQQKIVIEDPIKAYTFSLALKALLPKYEKSQLDIIISKIFHSSHLLSFQNFSLQLQPILNSKLVSLLEPESMRKELDRTLQKAKSLFVIWIQIEYFTKKIRQILRTSNAIYDSILLQCSSIEQPSRLDMELLQKYFLQGEKKNSVKKLKLAVFFRNTIGNDLLKSSWSDWIYKQEARLYNRYEGKAVFEKLNFDNPTNQRSLYMRANLSRKNQAETSIMNSSRKQISSRKRNI